MLWHDVQDGWQQRQAAGEPPFPALQEAIDAAFDARIGDISGRGKLAADMREIWMMQPRFERRAGNSALALLEQPRFRAGLDFLRLRGEVGEADPALAEWWEAFFQAGDDERDAMLEACASRAAGRAGCARVRPREAAGTAPTATRRGRAAARPPATRRPATPARRPTTSRRRPTARRRASAGAGAAARAIAGTPS